ncbi:MAG: aldo/keto reductase, partial [Nitrospirales bacterium]
ALAYGPLCRGLLTGKYRGSETFTLGDIRTMDPKFNAPRFEQYVACVDRLGTVAARSHKSVAQLAVRWCLDQPGVTVALCVARRLDQIEETADVSGWVLSAADRSEIDRIISETVIDPVGPEFMQPP